MACPADTLIDHEPLTMYYSPPSLQHSDPDFEDLQNLEEVEKRLAWEYEMTPPEGIYIDSVAVLQEARRRAKLPQRRFPINFLTFLQKNSESASKKNDVEKLHRLYHLRLKFTQLCMYIGPTPYYASRFWAVLIGIDAYESHPLQGCVSDALSMKDLLIEKLEVPGNRIQCLLGAKNPTRGDSLTPSRANIVDALYSLIDNTEIARGDNIIIYYAGHGSSYQCSSHSLTPLEGSKCRTGTCPIEALCPIDRDTKDAGGKWIPDISDRELNAIFTEISRTKGHKITFIADCCYASSVSRDSDPETGRRSMRGTHHSIVDDMLRAADGRLKGFPCYKSVLSKTWLPDMGSHVVLAACRDYQTAKETGEGGRWGGIFTRRLVYVLTSGECTKETTRTPLVSGCCIRLHTVWDFYSKLARINFLLVI
ncbi:caspase domain-containing protein [Armillaria nabsnona]|nr:caspase domain-containing protein [Armillaria nabsnona]